MKKLKTQEVTIGAYQFPDRKLPCLAVQKGTNVLICGHFNSIENAEYFMDTLIDMVCPNSGDIL